LLNVKSNGFNSDVSPPEMTTNSLCHSVECFMLSGVP
jgi:hypothetical protein